MKRCQHCGDPILHRRADARFCSDAHRVAAHRGRKTVQKRNAHRSRPPDLRISYRKTLAALTLKLGDPVEARTVLAPCLPPRMRDRT